MTRPEKVFARTHALPEFAFEPVEFTGGCVWHDDHAEAIAAACNAYPLALALADACSALALTSPDAHGHATREAEMHTALAAFLTHRQEPNNA